MLLRPAILTLTILFTACSGELIVPKPSPQLDKEFPTHPLAALYASELKAYQMKSNAPGAILALAKLNAPLWIGSTGFSNLEHETSMTNQTQFRTGSITKMFTAVVILKLHEEGKISLEDLLSERLPDTRGNISHADKITVRHLLSHLSGIVDPPNESLQYQADIINDPVKMQNMSIDERLKKYVYGKKLHFSPGTNYSYSNVNYWLLGKIAEKTTGETLQALMNDYIFSPLEMKNTYLSGNENEADVARGYADLYSDGKLMDVTVWDRAEGNGKADGGIISTAEDLVLFLTGLFENRLVSPSTLQDMITVQLKSCNSPHCEYGLGIEIWRTRAGTAYGHNGGLIGIEANALYFENNGAVSVLYKNNGNGSDKGFLDQLIKD